METRFRVNVPEAIFARRSPENFGNTSRDILMDSKNYQLLLECLKTAEPDSDSSIPRKMTPLKTAELLGRHFEASPSKNSRVMVRLSDAGSFAAVTIQSIFSHTRRTGAGEPVTQKFVTIQPFQPLSPAHTLRDLY